MLRRPPPGPLLASAHDVVREARVLRGLAGTDVRVPHVLAVCEGQELGGPMVLMEFVDGIVLDGATAAAGLNVRQRERVAIELATALAAVHRVDLEASGLGSLSRHDQFGRRQLRRWRAQWRASAAEERPVVDALADRLERALPKQRELTLVHGDYHLLNCVLDPDTVAVRGVLDWELCTLGEPLADLGMLLAYWAEPGEPVLDTTRSASALPGFASRAELERGYAAASGRDTSAAQFWRAFAHWKLAIIAQGVVTRARNRDVHFSHGRELVDGMLELAEQAAEAAGI